MYRAAEVNDAEHEDFYALPAGDGFGHHGIVQIQRAALDDLATAVGARFKRFGKPLLGPAECVLRGGALGDFRFQKIIRSAEFRRDCRPRFLQPFLPLKSGVV